jgi:hypothetical protein
LANAQEKDAIAMASDSGNGLLSETHNIFGSKKDYAQMFQMIVGFAVSQVVRNAALFSFAEHLARGPRTAVAIAEAESLNVDATFRLMRACASLGLVTYEGDSGFAATPLLRTLHKDDPNSLRGTALAQADSCHWLPWGRLAEAIRSGEPQDLAALGCSTWEHLAKTPAEAEAFTQFMDASSLRISREAATLIDTRSTSVAMDIGGASGTLVHALMKQNEALQGVVFDLPHIVPAAMKAAENLRLRDRFTVAGGDFFSSIPPADLYLLKWILHDWEDDACISILKNCRRSINPGGRIILIEMMIGEIGTPGIATLVDLTMLVLHGGRERSLHEYKTLLSATGFRFTGVTTTSTPFVLIEAIAI